MWSCRWLALVAVMLVWICPAPGGAVKDTESAKHDASAAEYAVVDAYEFPGFRIVQIELPVLSHFSYLVVGGKEVLVVDPGRDTRFYLDLAKKMACEIKGVWLSHSHADFIAGHIEIAKQLGVPIRISAKANAGYEHTALEDGATMDVGEAHIRFLATPGHTPDGMCATIAAKSMPDRLLAMLSGDTLFIGSVGRPDLMGAESSASSLAAMMFETWTNKLSKLPDDMLILPAHGAGSLCGAHLSDQPSSTLGEQRVANAYLRYRSRGEFIAAVLDGLPQAPAYFAHDAAINRKGPELVDWTPAALPLTPVDDALADPAKTFLVDLRDAAAYAEGHVPGSVNIALRGRLETWVGIMVPWDANLVVTGSEVEMKEAVSRLHRVGYHPKAIAFEEWTKAGRSQSKNEMVAPKVLHDRMGGPDCPIIIDVRLPAEWMAMRIGTVLNIPLNVLAVDGPAKISRDERVVAVCNSAYRSSMAVGVLERAGFKNVASLAGGSEAWIESGLPVFEARAGVSASARPKREVKLAERISAEELKRLILDLPGTFTLVDIRPREHFVDYALPGAVNVPLADLLDDPSYLVGVGPLVIVDRDGSLGMMVAGILSQKTERRIKALYGGLQAYWSESSPAGRPLDLRMPGSGAAPAPAPVPGEAPKSAKPRKSGGC